MKEFMLLILNRGDSTKSLLPDKHMEFVKKCEMYIEQLKKERKLVSAQPLAGEGKIISGSNGNWQEFPVNDRDEVQVGYYHILAKDIDEAVAIAKGNPEFATPLPPGSKCVR